MNFRERNDLFILENVIECVFIEVDKSVFGLNKNMLVGVVYRPPNSSVHDFTEAIQPLLYKIKRENKICHILGDYNIDLLKSDTHTPTAEFLDQMYTYSFIPLINRPTRVTNSSATLIDNIFTNHISQEYDIISGILLTKISDHFPIFYCCDKIIKCQNNDVIITHKICAETIDTFSKKLAELNWDALLSEEDPQNAYDLFYDVYSSLYVKCFPKVVIKKGYKTRKLWLTEDLKTSIKHKNKLYFLWKEIPTHQKDKEYKQYKSQLSKELVNAERNYYHDILEKHKGNMKKFWQVTRTLINKNASKPVQSIFKHNGIMVEDGNLIAEHFNDFFVNVGPSTASKIPKSNISPQSYLKGNYINSFYTNPVTSDELEKLLQNIKDSACGWDNLETKVIKSTCKNIIAPFLHICNLSLSKGIFPRQLKIAKVVPIYKADDPMIFTNYRPVSVFPIFSKILERIMYNRLLEYLNKHNLLHAFQFGLRKNILLLWPLFF